MNALSGTALLIAEVVAKFADDPELPVELLGASAFEGGIRALEGAVGVYRTDVVVALEPAADDPEDENELEAPGPEVPDEALA